MSPEKCKELKIQMFIDYFNKKKIKREDIKEHLEKLRIEYQKVDALCNEGPRLVRDILPEVWADFNEKRRKLNLPPIDWESPKNKAP